MLKLSNANLNALAPDVSAPRYDHTQRRSGIAHVGVGHFHRSHQAMYVDRLMRAGDALDWAICGVGVLPGDARSRDILREQDYLYTLTVRGIRHPRRSSRTGRCSATSRGPARWLRTTRGFSQPSTRGESGPRCASYCRGRRTIASSRSSIGWLEWILHTDPGVLLTGVEILRKEHSTANLGGAADDHRIPE